MSQPTRATIHFATTAAYDNIANRSSLANLLSFSRRPHALSEVSWRTSSPSKLCKDIFSRGLPVPQINQKCSEFLYHCQTSRISRKLFYFPVYYFTPYQNTMKPVVEWFRLALIPEMAVNTWHPGDFSELNVFFKVFFVFATFFCSQHTFAEVS